MLKKYHKSRETTSKTSLRTSHPDVTKHPLNLNHVQPARKVLALKGVQKSLPRESICLRLLAKTPLPRDLVIAMQFLIYYRDTDFFAFNRHLIQFFKIF